MRHVFIGVTRRTVSNRIMMRTLRTRNVCQEAKYSSQIYASEILAQSHAHAATPRTNTKLPHFAELMEVYHEILYVRNTTAPTGRISCATPSYEYKNLRSLPDVISDCFCAVASPSLVLFRSYQLLVHLLLHHTVMADHYDNTLGAEFIGCLFTAVCVSSRQ